ncbi:MAG: peptidase T [Arcanobacterium sp.]|nr:peptidase T [Arcanobacterium sp.]
MPVEPILDRFVRYVQVPSQSDAASDSVPSSPSEWEMARLLESELQELGLAEVHVSEFACVTAKLPATNSTAARRPAIGFVTHFDTADAGLSPHVNPQIVRSYDGGVIALGESAVLDPAQYPALARYVGQDIVTTDGTSVLGADDKAGVAAVMDSLAQVVQSEAEHGEVYVAFVPDEEIGLLGAKHLDLQRFTPAYAFTVDGGELGELVYETFNAARASIDIEGVAAHPIDAKGVMVNPVLVATDFIAMFDRLQTPENTDGRDGYHWIQEMHATPARAQLIVNIRDHDRERFEWRKEYVQRAVALLAERYPRADIACTIHDEYGNIHDALTEENKVAVEQLKAAFAAVGITPITAPTRGGTDGSYLSAQGLFTPNFFAGGHNFHSKYEFLPVPSLEKAAAVVRTLIMG